ncbi:MAG: ERCC4 domain-containing protein [Gaiellaceae bacterium]
MEACVVVDVRELASRVPGELERLGARVSRVRMPVGDYDVGRGILVERKHVRDLRLTLASGRYWRQVGALRRYSAWPVVLIEGPHLAAGPLDADAVRGACLATAEQGVVVLRAENAAESAEWLVRMAARAHIRRRDRPPYAQIPKRRPPEVPEAMLAAVPGISTVTARALLREFKTIAGVASADPGAWARVPGMGDRRTCALAEAFHRRRAL